MSTTECSDGEPALFNSLDGLVSILSADGIAIIYEYTDETNKKEYGIHADKLSGAIGSSVKIGGD